MKTLITATALTLFANSALAFDIYGGFSNPDLRTTSSNSYGVEIPAGRRVTSSIPDSLGDYYAGNPDVYSGSIPGYVPVRDFDGPRYSSYDELTFGNPDSGTVSRFDVTTHLVPGRAVVSRDGGNSHGA